MSWLDQWPHWRNAGTVQASRRPIPARWDRVATFVVPAHLFPKSEKVQRKCNNVKTATKKPERRRKRVSKSSKRYRVGGVFTKDRRIDFYRALELSFNMAIEFYATLVTHTRVVLAKREKDGTESPHVPEKWPSALLARRLGRLPSVRELTDAFTVEVLSEMEVKILDGLARHIDAFNRGYGDALRSNRLRAKVRELFRNSKGRLVHHPDRPRGILWDGWTYVNDPNSIVVASGNIVAKIASRRFSLGSESSARCLLKPVSEKKRFYLDEIEPRIRKSGTRGKGAP